MVRRLSGVQSVSKSKWKKKVSQKPWSVKPSERSEDYGEGWISYGSCVKTVRERRRIHM